MRYLRFSGLVGLVLLLMLSTAQAQLVPGLTPGTSGDAPADVAGDPETDAAKIRLFTSLLADPSVQAWLIDRGAELEAEAEGAAGDPAAGTGNPVVAAIERIQGTLALLGAGLEALPGEANTAALIWSLEMGDGETLWSIVYVLIFLSAGIAAEHVFWRASRGVRQRILTAPRGTFGAKLQLLLMRVVYAILSLLFFAVGSIGVFLIFDWAPIVRLFTLTFLSAFVLVRMAEIISRLVLAPWVDDLRLIPIDGATARLLHGWIRAMAAVGAFGFLTCAALDDLGFFTQSHVLLVTAVGGVLALQVIALTWRTRRGVSNAIGRDADQGRWRASVADLWPVLATLWILLVWGLWAIGALGLMGTLAVIGLLPFGLTAARALSERIALAARRRAEDRGSDDEEGRPTYQPILQRLLRIVVVAVALAALALSWQISLGNLTSADGAWSAWIGGIFKIVLTLLLADLIWQAVKVTIDRQLTDTQGPAAPAADHGGEGGGVAGPKARLRTLLPLVRKFLLSVLLVMAAMIVLSSLGVDIGPLLAGAGVVGIAIGFGAQALVRDIVAGIFFLVDDAFRVGEYIEIGELRGTVESISIRSLRLRHHRGAVHTIPFGEMRHLTNYSRDWVIMKLEFRVPFDTDLSLVKKLVKQIGKELLADPTVGHSFLEPLKSQGVRRWEEFNMVIGVKFMAKPGEQWLIRREAYQRIRDTFEANGIHFASRDVQVRVNPDASPQEIEQAAAAAAHEAAQRQEPALGDGGPKAAPA